MKRQLTKQKFTILEKLMLSPEFGILVPVLIMCAIAYTMNHNFLKITNIAYIINTSAFYGFLAGVCAGNHDITDVLVDATLRIGSRDCEELADFLAKVDALSKETEVKFTFTVSTETENIPERVNAYCELK